MWMCGFLLRSINVSPFLGSLHFRLGSGARHKHLLTMRENLWTSLLFMLMLIISSAFSFIIGKEHTYEHEHTIRMQHGITFIETPEQMSKTRGEMRTKRYEMLLVE